ncbi:MAG: response regulator transcription factor [Flavobacterium sp.]|nr:response regulator transcription factor [Flavobacterium sp.]
MKILIVEDDVLMAKTIEFRLKKDGYEVVLAPDGREALKFITEFDFDLVVSDIMLPFNSGLEVLNFLKSKTNNNTPIIMLSSFGAENIILEAFNLGADDYITKPFSPIELSLRVKRLLKKLSKN